VISRLRALSRNIFRRKKLDEELDEELQAYLELMSAEKIRAGMAPEDAYREARRSTGGMEQVKQGVRDVRVGVSLDRLAQDVRYSLRTLARNPAFSLVAVVTLALGIGANVAIFTLVQGILLRSLPVSDPARLYRIGDRTDCCFYAGFENDDGDFDLFSYDLYLHFKQVAPEFEELAAVQAGGGDFSVRWGASPAKALRAEYVTGNYFSALGVGAFAGRPLSVSDDVAGAAPVVVLSYQTWQTEFGRDVGVVGSAVYIQQHAFTIAGIAPPGFFGDRVAPSPPDMWLPLASEPVFEGANSSLLDPDTDWLYAIGRVRPGVNLGSTQTKLSVVLRQWMGTRPAYSDHGGAAEIPKQHVVLSPAGGGIQKLQRQTGASLRMLMLLSGVVLLIACANIANLLLARSMARRAEIAVRIGLGATRGRVIRQIFTEGLVLSLIGGIAGLVVAFLGARMILALAFPVARNMPISTVPSWPVLAFAVAVSLLTGSLFAAAPAWVLSHAQPAEASRGNNSSSRDHSSIPQRMLLVFQLTLSIVLLVSAFLMTRSLYNLEHQNFGFDTANRYALQIDLKGAGYTPEKLPAIYGEIQERLSALPGMVNMSFARYLPLGGNEWGSCVIEQGRPTPGPNDKCFADWDRVSWRFLDSIGVPIVRGRGFTEDDESGQQQVAIVNQTFAKRFFHKEDPIGKRFGINGQAYSGAFQIVGVFADFKLSDARGEAGPLFLRPLGQRFAGYKEADNDAAETSSLYLDTMVVQLARPAEDAEKVVRATLAGIDPNITVTRFTPYEATVAANFNQDRLIARLTGAFGVLALVLASVGLYGVMSYVIARRTTEIGIRMAMGASRATIVSMVLRGAFAQVLIGLALGIPASLYAGHLITSLLYQVHGNDLWALLSATAALGLCADVAAIVPAYRAASLDPMDALRTE
jgi:macrolide transport system ATP-binding/permease protein